MLPMLRMRRVFCEIASEHITSSLQKLEQEEGQVFITNVAHAQGVL